MISDNHFVRVPQDVDVVNVSRKTAKSGECPAFFSVHVDSNAFVLADLAAIYATRMEQLGTIVTRRVHSRPLKNRILRDCKITIKAETYYWLPARIFVQRVSRQLPMTQLMSPGLPTQSDKTC